MILNDPLSNPQEREEGRKGSWLAGVSWWLSAAQGLRGGIALQHGFISHPQPVSCIQRGEDKKDKLLNLIFR